MEIIIFESNHSGVNHQKRGKQIIVLAEKGNTRKFFYAIKTFFAWVLRLHHIADLQFNKERIIETLQRP